ncbi:DUF1761 domain-containing protein [Candidatus Uhrbacteria bacterium]|nr:DUF1761 domain-containing protein [Candidatus Uhrbacteria bacterium]
MSQINVNLWAVLVAAIVQMAIGFAWYSKALFGAKWLALIGKTEEDMKKGGSMGKVMGLSFVSSLIMAYVLAHVLFLIDATTVTMGLQAGFWLWLGFVATTSFMKVLYEHRSKKLYLIDVGYYLVCMLAMGAILAAW